MNQRESENKSGSFARCENIGSIKFSRYSMVKSSEWGRSEVEAIKLEKEKQGVQLAVIRAMVEWSREGQVGEKGRDSGRTNRAISIDGGSLRQFKSNQLEKFDFPSFRSNAFHEIATAFPFGLK